MPQQLLQIHTTKDDSNLIQHDRLDIKSTNVCSNDLQHYHRVYNDFQPLVQDCPGNYTNGKNINGAPKYKIVRMPSNY